MTLLPSPEKSHAWPKLSGSAWVFLCFGLGFPTLLTWCYFVLLAPGGAKPSPSQQIVYALGKILQFSWPVLCYRLFVGVWPKLSWPGGRGVSLGLAFGAVVGLAFWFLYTLVLRTSPLMETTPTQVRAKVIEMGLASPARFIGFAFFVVVLHSLLEEYYWRWFMFGWLRAGRAWTWAACFAGLGFMAHHVLVLHVYLPGYFWPVVVPFSLGIAVGGFAWAWLYHQTDNLSAPWVSHALVDAGIFVVGYDIFFRF